MSVLGLTEYYRRFIEDYAEHTFILTEATKESAPDVVVWFLFPFPCPSDLFVLQTDASGVGLGRSLVFVVRRRSYQWPSPGNRKLKPRERRCSATELEGLAVVAAIQHFCPYLIKHSFVVEMNHRALAFLNTTRHANFCLTRWALILQPYSFTIHYRPGSQNANADAFSRLVGVEADYLDDLWSPEEGGDVMRPP